MQFCMNSAFDTALLHVDYHPQPQVVKVWDGFKLLTSILRALRLRLTTLLLRVQEFVIAGETGRDQISHHSTGMCYLSFKIGPWLLMKNLLTIFAWGSQYHWL